MELLISENEIKDKVAELAKSIIEYYKDNEEIVLVTVLRGGLDFSDDLVKELRKLTDKKLILDDMIVKSYKGTTSTGTINVEKDLKTEVKGKEVLLLEDIIDSGHTLKFLLEHFKKKEVKSIEMCTLLDKSEKREVEVNPLFVGFDIPDVFVVGYGMDYNGDFRDMKDIMILDGKEK